jgi:hypothetical protein
LLLTTGERTGRLRTSLPQDVEEIEDSFEILTDATLVLTREARRASGFSSTVSLGKILRPSWRMRQHAVRT